MDIKNHSLQTRSIGVSGWRRTIQYQINCEDRLSIHTLNLTSPADTLTSHTDASLKIANLMMLGVNSRLGVGMNVNHLSFLPLLISSQSTFYAWRLDLGSNEINIKLNPSFNPPFDVQPTTNNEVKTK